MKVLIIGGSGVISYDVAILAIQKGIETVTLNRGSSLHRNRTAPGALFIVANIRNSAEVIASTKGMYFDVVVDFLSYTPVQLRQTISLFANNCKQYIFISSATVYETKNNQSIKSEKTSLANPKWDYANNKIICEQLLREKCKQLGLHYTIVRPYVTYGDTRIPFAVIPRRSHWSLISRLLRGKPILMWDDGNARCTLTHSSDFAKGLVGLFGNRRAYNTAVHITSDEILTWNEVLSIVSETIGKKPIVVNIPSSDIENGIKELSHELVCDKATDMVFDNTKIKSIVPDFKCEIPFREGIKRTISFYQNNPHMMKVDYGWDAQIDRLIYGYCSKHNRVILKKTKLFNIALNDQTFRDKVAYYSERYAMASFLKRIFIMNTKAMCSRAKKLVLLIAHQAKTFKNTHKSGENKG